MAMSGGKDDGDPMMEMNMTPMIDVLLVLLILFIITIPVQTHAVKIDLPVNQPENQVIVDPIKNRIFIDPSSATFWNGQPISREALRVALVQAAGTDPQPQMEFEPDANAPYLTIDQILADIKKAGILNLGFVGNHMYGTFGKATRPAQLD